MPESKADQSKADLLTSANEAAGLVQKVFFTYLLVSLYLAILIGSTTHEQMLRESGIQLPLFGVPLSVFWVYAIAPWLYLALHVNLLVQHYFLSRKLDALNHALRPLSAEEAKEWRVRLYPSMFAQMLAGAERRTFKRFVLRSIVFLTVAVAPIVLLIWMQIQFLPYHSEPVTWGHRLALFVDLTLLWYYWPLMMSDEDTSWRQVVIQEGPLFQLSVCALFSIWVLWVSWVVAVVPGGLAERMTFTKTDERRWDAATTCDATAATNAAKPTGITALVPQCLRAPRRDIRSCLTRHLNVREAKLLAEEPHPEVEAALMNGGDGTEANGVAETMKRTVGLVLEGRDLRGANFRGADLTKADLAGARLDGADLGCTKLIGANLSEADLRDANLTEAALQGVILEGVALPGYKFSQSNGLGKTVNFKKARLIGADLKSMDMDGADLSHAKLQGASLEGAKLRGAKLENIDLRGANLKGAQLQGADLSSARLLGADLRGASVAGAKFANAALSYADLRGIMDTHDKVPEVIETLRKLVKDGDRLAEAAVKRLTSAFGKPIDFRGAKGESVRCQESPKIDEIECLKENNKMIDGYPKRIEEYRKTIYPKTIGEYQEMIEEHHEMLEDYCKTIEGHPWCLANYVLAPLFCDLDEESSEAEASSLLVALLDRVSLLDNGNKQTSEPSPKEKLQAKKGTHGVTKKKSGDAIRSTTSLLTEALRNRSDCHGREVLSETKFDTFLAQPNKRSAETSHAE